MATDRFTQIALAVIAAALTVIAISFASSAPRWLRGTYTTVAEAQQDPCKVSASIPRAWGRVVGITTVYGADYRIPVTLVIEGNDAVRFKTIFLPGNVRCESIVIPR